MYCTTSKKDNIVIKVIIKYIKSKPFIYKHFNFSYHTQLYTLYKLLEDILYVLKTGISWRDLRSNIYWNTVYKAYIKLNNFKVFKLSYVELLNKYIYRTPSKKLKFISTDTSFIPNKCGQNKIGYNKFYNRKYGSKISLISDNRGNAINVKVYKGNKSDSKILLDHLKNDYLINNNMLNSNIKYFLADAGYDTKAIRKKLFKLGYKILIPQNKRNIKDDTKIIKFTKYQKNIFKNRLKIENKFSQIKSNKRLLFRYDVKVSNFYGFIYLALLKTIH